MKHYFIRLGKDEWKETTREEWIRYERSAGFVPKGMNNLSEGYWTTQATSGFSTSNSGGIEGTSIDITYYKPEYFAHDPSFPILEV